MGWVRANILYDKGPMPKLNSYQEVVHILVFEARQAANIAGTRALAQAALGGKQAVDAFDKYRELLTAPAEAAKQQEMQKALDNVGKMGPIKFRPLAGPQKSKNIPTFSRPED